MSDDCAVCAALAEKAERGEVYPDLRCTLHGGAMTATEVQMRFTHEVVGDPPTWQLSEPKAPFAFAGVIDALRLKIKELTGE